MSENSTETGRDVDDADQIDSESERIMRDWRRWSEKWEVSLRNDEDTFAETGFAVDGDTIERPHCDSEALMQDWRAWSERWKRSVKSR